MKRALVFLVICFVYNALLAQTNRLESYQVSSFGGVTRISFTFSSRPITNVIKEANSMRVSIDIPNTSVVANLPLSFTTPDVYARRVEISRQNNRDLLIRISTDSSFETIRQSVSTGSRYIVHVDIIRSLTPVQVSDFIGLLDYYHHTRNTEALRSALDTVSWDFSQNRQVIDRQQNRFVAPRVFAPQIQQREQPATPPSRPPTVTTPSTPATQQVATPPIRLHEPPAQTVVTPQQSEPVPVARPPDLPIELLPALVPDDPPVAEPLSPTTSPRPMQVQLAGDIPAVTTPKVDINDASFTLVSRHDRLPTRIPQTKNIFRPVAPEPEPVPEPDPEPVPLEEIVAPEPIESPRTPDPVPVPPVVETRPELPPPVIIHAEPIIERRLVLDIADLDEIERKILTYYNIVKVDSIRTDFMVGIKANIAGDHQTAVDLLKKVPPYDLHYEEAIRWLHDSYNELGDHANTAFYASLLSMINDDDSSSSELINTPVQLWVAGVGAIITMLIGVLITVIAMKSRKSKTPVVTTEAEFAVHQKNLERAYESKTIFEKDNIDTDDNRIDRTISDQYDNPPIVTEGLEIEEETEMIQDESDSIVYTSPVVRTPDPPQEDDIDDFVDDGGYKKRMVLKLHNESGWKVEEIAKELQISQREIEFILKMNR